MAEGANDAAVDAIASLVPATLRALYALEFAGRHLSPANLPRLIEAIAGRDVDVERALSGSRAVAWPERLQPVRARLERAAEAAGDGIAGLLAASEAPQPIVAAYRGLRAYARAAEALYPMAAHLKPVSQFFLESAARDDAALAARLAAVDPARAAPSPYTCPNTTTRRAPGRWSWRCTAAAATAVPSCGAGCARPVRAV